MIQVPLERGFHRACFMCGVDKGSGWTLTGCLAADLRLLARPVAAPSLAPWLPPVA